MTKIFGWEQASAVTQLHAYDGHDVLPVCGLEAARRYFDDKVPRTLYIGPMPPPPERICEKCRTWERDHDPMFLAGCEYARKKALEECLVEVVKVWTGTSSVEIRNAVNVVEWWLHEQLDTPAWRLHVQQLAVEKARRGIPGCVHCGGRGGCSHCDTASKAQ